MRSDTSPGNTRCGFAGCSKIYLKSAAGLFVMPSTQDVPFQILQYVCAIALIPSICPLILSVALILSAVFAILQFLGSTAGLVLVIKVAFKNSTRCE